VEVTGKWLRYGNPREVARPEIAYDVELGGHTETRADADGRYRVRWIPSPVVRGGAYDTPIVAYRVGTANGSRSMLPPQLCGGNDRVTPC
jgi:starch phosphorylase